MPRRVRLLSGSVLLLLLAGGTVPATARPLPSAPHTAAMSAWDRLVAWWGAVAKDIAQEMTATASPYGTDAPMCCASTDNGSGIDPFGKPASSTQDVGSGIDPFGGQ